jgi:hypothetical protein
VSKDRCPACGSPACVGVTPVSIWCSKSGCRWASTSTPPKYKDTVTVKLSSNRAIRTAETDTFDGQKVTLMSVYATIVEVTAVFGPHNIPRKFAFLPEEIVELKPFLVWISELEQMGISDEYQFTAPFH